MFRKCAWFGFSLLVMLFLVSACGSEGSDSAAAPSSSAANSGGERYTNETFAKIYDVADKHKGDKVELMGRVFVVEQNGDEVYIQMYADPKNMAQNTLVTVKNPELKVGDGDYIQVKGTLSGTYTGENAFGAKITVPLVEASTVEVIDYTQAVAPTLKFVEVNETKQQHGYLLTLEKIEMAANETRVYVTVENRSPDTITFYSFNAKAIQGQMQLDGGEMNFDADYPEVQSEIMPGVKSSGVVLFPAFDREAGAVTLHFEGGSDNWNLDFQPFVFEVSW